MKNILNVRFIHLFQFERFKPSYTVLLLFNSNPSIPVFNKLDKFLRTNKYNFQLS